MFADVVVLTYQSPDIPYFTYKIPANLEKEIKVGQLVEVPFGSRKPMGIVIGKRDTKQETRDEIKIKDIGRIVATQPLLLPYQVRLALWMSKYYLAPMVNCVEAMLPFNVKQVSSAKARPLPKISLTLRPGLSQASQTLVLLPTLNRIAQTLALFPKARNYVIYTNELKPS